MTQRKISKRGWSLLKKTFWSKIASKTRLQFFKAGVVLAMTEVSKKHAFELSFLLFLLLPLLLLLLLLFLLLVFLLLLSSLLLCLKTIYSMTLKLRTMIIFLCQAKQNTNAWLCCDLGIKYWTSFFPTWTDAPVLLQMITWPKMTLCGGSKFEMLPWFDLHLFHSKVFECFFISTVWWWWCDNLPLPLCRVPWSHGLNTLPYNLYDNYINKRWAEDIFGDLTICQYN